MDGLTHFDAEGRARMVDVSSKPVTARVAVARGRLSMQPGTRALIEAGRVEKGDVLGVARVAGIQAAKAAAGLLPLAHTLSLDAVDMRFHLPAGEPAVEAEASVTVTARTGAEMEALTAVTVALLTVYDMAKAVDRSMVIGEVRLVKKSGGRTGDWGRDGETTWA